MRTVREEAVQTSVQENNESHEVSVEETGNVIFSCRIFHYLFFATITSMLVTWKFVCMRWVYRKQKKELLIYFSGVLFFKKMQECVLLFFLSAV